MRKTFVVLLAIIVMAAPLPCVAGETIVMVFGNGYPPFYSFSETEATEGPTLSGAYAEFLAAFELQHPEYLIRKVRLPRMRMDQWIRSGDADAVSLNSPLFVSAADKEKISFSYPIWTSSDHCIVRATSIMESAKTSQLKGKRVGLIHGNGYGQLDALVASGQVEEQRVYKTHQLPKLLLAGRVDCYVDNRHAAPLTWEHAGHEAEQFKMLMPSLYQFDLSVVVRKENVRFLADLNAFIEQSRNNGFLTSINEKYFTYAVND